ncbi:MAG: proline--tRNA ligase [Elusimicrobia bacterium]|nr:MAG: proline--tRNA ligase [Elusimicrobiota bacterium]
MLLSKYLLPTLKEIPREAEIPSHQLMIRSGIMRQLASGIYEWLPLGLRVLHKVENIIREEMDSIGAQEVSLPAMQPRELWEESGRWDFYGKELIRLKDRNRRDFCLGPTHEEVITDLVRREVRSYKELPLLLYQFQTKFRDEIRPRFGVIRAREFYMKDAYSFDATDKNAETSYNNVFETYSRIFQRCGLKFRSVEAQTGAIGGAFSHEFMVIADTGEEIIVSCKCGYAANLEKAEGVPPAKVGGKAGKRSGLKELEEVETKNMKTVEEVGKFLKEKPDKFIKTLVYKTNGECVIVMVRGDHEVNESKVKSYLGVNEIFLADEKTIKEVTGAPLGFAGPVGLKIKCKLLADYSVEGIVNGVTGANKKDYHLKNVNINRDYSVDEILDLRRAKEGDVCPKCGKTLEFSRGIEVGHTFKLGTKYSKTLRATFLDKDGKEKYFVMGCYGIGVSRIVAAAIEQSHDQNGIIWPLPIAPFQVLILPVNYEHEKIRTISNRIYKQLESAGYEVLMDDRDERAGVKFKDADLIGIPIRVTVGEKTLAKNIVEVKLRGEKEVREVEPDQVQKLIQELTKK